MDAQHSDWPSARALVEWRERRRRYITLYQRKLAVLKHCASSSNLQKQVTAAPHDDYAYRQVLSYASPVGQRLPPTPKGLGPRPTTVRLRSVSSAMSATLCQCASHEGGHVATN